MSVRAICVISVCVQEAYEKIVVVEHSTLNRLSGGTLRQRPPAEATWFIDDGMRFPRCAKTRMASPAKQVLRGSDFPKVLESAWAEQFFRLRFFGTIRLRDMDRCSGRELPAAASTAGFHAVHMLSILRGIRLDSGEWVEAGEKVDSTERQQILRLAVSRRKQKGDVVQLVRMLPCHGRGRGFEPRRPRHSK
jgi:hypothetical protein